jgi:hypothetical protein
MGKSRIASNHIKLYMKKPSHPSDANSDSVGNIMINKKTTNEIEKCDNARILVILGDPFHRNKFFSAIRS